MTEARQIPETLGVAALTPRQFLMLPDLAIARAEPAAATCFMQVPSVRAGT